jgi:hypothetical protein
VTQPPKEEDLKRREDYGKGDLLVIPKRLTQNKRIFELKGLTIECIYYSIYYLIIIINTFKDKVSSDLKR